MKGHTLVELLVSIAIISVLTLLVSTKFNVFRQDAIVNSGAEEFASFVRTAKNKSITGEIGEGEQLSDFNNDLSDSLPKFGVETTAVSYSLFREFIPDGETTAVRETLQTISLDSGLLLSGDPEVVFARVTGKSAAQSFVIEKPGYAEKREIEINDQGLIAVKKIF